MELSELFYTHLYIFGGGLLLACGGLAYRPRCSEVSIMWGCCSFKRDISSEIENDEHIQIPNISLPDVEAPPENQDINMFR